MRLNIGCGATPTPEWINFDNSWAVRLAKSTALVGALARVGILNEHQVAFARVAADKKIIWANASRRVPLPDGTVSVVYSSHMLEHLDRTEVRQFLAEVHRVLSPGGVVRIVVPDLRKFARRYIEGTFDADAFVAATKLAMEKPRGVLDVVRQLATRNRDHRWMYDAASLIRLLEAAGFHNAVEVPAGNTTIPDPGQLDLREREDQSVYVEARRP